MTRAVEKPKTPVIWDVELPQDRALRRTGERLRGAVTDLPLRYAPFFARLAQLWEAPQEQVVSELTRAKDPQSWQRSLLPGLKTFDLRLGPGGVRGRARLLRFAPGARFPKHRHHGGESVLVLEGSYADGDGREVGPGQLQTMPEGSEHELVILGRSPCIAAVSERGLEFTGPLLRWASKLLG
jgi:putative transcriptional regulator